MIMTLWPRFFSAHPIVPRADRTPKLSGLVLDRITVYDVVVERDVLGKSTIAVGVMKLRLSRYNEAGRYMYMYVNADIGIYYSFQLCDRL